MQKILRHSGLARRQAARKAKKLEEKENHLDTRRWLKEEVAVRRAATQNMKVQRLAQREDWYLGPLAPKRLNEHTIEKYATVDLPMLQTPELPKHYKLQPFQPLHAGERVVILEGNDKGRIGTIMNIDEKTDRIRIKGMNKFNIWQEEWLRKANNTTDIIAAIEHSLPSKHVRLVYPLINKNGHKKDTIIERCEIRQEYVDDELEDVRYITGTNIAIPGPEDASKPKENHAEDFDGDTLRILTEAETWVPPLLTPPMPESAIDEIKNKYSKYRIRHDEEYTERKLEEDRAERRRQLSGMSMWSPRQEAAEIAKRKKEPVQPLDLKMLEKMGAVMVARQRMSARTASST
ncbi:hypothetical protein K402DRAFT_466332 [Aulographum hederae CBS 113979]|uniref:KOW domain-containing protein n=1 Tax=Aulographum hederae CBS 113979 TaxID=1176131 RepID=A0A6G1GQ78_9PEZI|nr:hypothetical protein K402DRAFT_466332 [Aulographum hederae CBS 113979]